MPDDRYTCQACRRPGAVRRHFVEQLSSSSTLWTVPSRCPDCGGPDVCPHCGADTLNPGHADTAAGRFCRTCCQYEGLPDANGPRLPYECPRCSQLADELHGPAGSRVCGACRDADRAPQGEAVRLFTPAPTQLPGQLDIGAEMHGPDGLGGTHA